MAPVVPEHQPAGGVAAGQVAPLVVPGRHFQTEPVAEDDRQRRILVADLFDVQRDTVVGNDRAGASAQRAERLERARVRPEPGAAHGVTLGRRTRGEAGRNKPDRSPRPCDEHKPPPPHRGGSQSRSLKKSFGSVGHLNP